jgi:OHCU decarboxylase
MSSLDEFNQLPPEVAAAELLSVCHSTRWAAQVAQARPFADLAAAQKVADEVWQALGPDDWRAALDGHPRIGEQGGSSQAFSRQEQAGLAGVASQVKAAIAEGNRVYEERFGHVFLISAAGRTPEEILDNLDSRLDNDPGTELVVAAEQHRRITRLRLEKLLG